MLIPTALSVALSISLAAIGVAVVVMLSLPEWKRIAADIDARRNQVVREQRKHLGVSAL